MSEAVPRFPGLTTRRAFWIVFLCALVMRAGFILATQPFRIVDGTEEVAIAHSLAERNAFADPYAEPTGPTAHSAPAYPFLLSLVYRAFGVGTLSAELVKEAFSTLGSALQFALLPAVAVACGLPLAAGLIAGLLGALLPIHPYLEVKGEWAAPYLGLVLLLLVWLQVRFWREPEGRTRSAWWRGAAFGVSLWFTPVLLPVLLAWLLAELLWFSRKTGREAWRAVIVSGAIMALFQVPWTIRNAVRLGSPVWSRDNLALELHNAFHDYSKASLEATQANLAANQVAPAHPNVRAEAGRVRELGEIAYNTGKRQEAIEWIRDHPARAIQLVLQRTTLFWFPFQADAPRAAFLSTLSLMALGGWWLLRRKNQMVFVLLGAVWLVYPMVYYLLQSTPRYAYPIFWSKLLAAGVLIGGASRVLAVRNRVLRDEP